MCLSEHAALDPPWRSQLGVVQAWTPRMTSAGTVSPEAIQAHVRKTVGMAALPRAQNPRHRLEAQLPGMDEARSVCEEGRRPGPACFPLTAAPPVRSREGRDGGQELQRLRPVREVPAGQLLSGRRWGSPHPSVPAGCGLRCV